MKWPGKAFLPTSHEVPPHPPHPAARAGGKVVGTGRNENGAINWYAACYALEGLRVPTEKKKTWAVRKEEDGLRETANLVHFQTGRFRPYSFRPPHLPFLLLPALLRPSRRSV